MVENTRRGRPIIHDRPRPDTVSSSIEYRREAMRKYRMKYPERVRGYTDRYFNKTYNCDCGMNVLMKSKFSHLKSNRHMRMLQEIN